MDGEGSTLDSSPLTVGIIRWRKLGPVGLLVILGLALIASYVARPDRDRELVVWAWDRPEDLRFLPDHTSIAILAGTVILSGDQISAVPRGNPVLAGSQLKRIAVVHIEIDHRRPLVWSDDLSSKAAKAVLAIASEMVAQTVQVDFEVRASERGVLLDLLTDVRAGLPKSINLSMTALASWCDTETWLSAAPVQEIVPMLFRMGAAGEPLKRRLTAGGDFHLARCRDAIGIAFDTLPDRLPVARRIYVFDPHSWTAQDFEAVIRRGKTW